MKIRLFIMAAICCAIGSDSIAQKFDNIWLAGDDNDPLITNMGGIVIDFDKKPLKPVFHYRELNMFSQNASICDSSGNLLFYTNGCDIAGADDKILEHGDGLNPGYFHDRRCDEFVDGYGGGFPSAVILPFPEIKDKYCLFHLNTVYIQAPVLDAYNRFLHYTVISKKEGTDEYIVTDKNKVVVEDSLAAGEMCAVKHGNGRDWWLIQPRRNSNQFYVFLFTKNGITDTLLQTIGDKAPAAEEGSGQTVFAHDGSRMARYYPDHDLMFYDFDRNSGQFSSYRTVKVDYGNHLGFDGGCAFSPGGRFFYVLALIRVYQFDLWASNISASQTLVGEWDGFKDPIAVTFGDCQLGPDCKIYAATADMRYYHIIHNPDAAGLDCQFEQRGLKLPTPSGASIPYFPNYRLGPVDNPGKPCSPVVRVSDAGEDEVGVRVWPNPTIGQINIDYHLTPNNARNIFLINSIGQIVAVFELPSDIGKTQFNVEHLPAGIYSYLIPGTVSGKIVIGQ